MNTIWHVVRTSQFYGIAWVFDRATIHMPSLSLMAVGVVLVRDILQLT